jgi:hypothetical protein
MKGNISKMRGVLGATGPQGPIGPQGEQGPIGNTPSIKFQYDETTGVLSYSSDGILVDKEYIDSANIHATEQGGEIFNNYDENIASNKNSHAEGSKTEATGENAHAEGYKSKAGGKGFRITHYYHVTGQVELDSVEGLAVGDVCTIVLNSDYPNCGTIRKIEGLRVSITYSGTKPTEVYDINAHASNAEKNILRVTAKPDVGTIFIGRNSHAEGWNTRTIGYGSHAEGRDTTTAGNYSHTEGRYTTTIGSHTHAEGYMTTAEGKNSHTEGHCTKTTGEMAHAEGNYTIASGENQHVQGRFNIVNPHYAHIVGNGWDEDSRSNAHTLDWDGNAWYAGNLAVGGYIVLTDSQGSRWRLVVETEPDGLGVKHVLKLYADVDVGVFPWA